MKTLPILFLLITLVFGVRCTHSQNQTPVTLMDDYHPQLIVKNDSTILEINSLKVDIKVDEGLTFITYDMTFYNPSDRILEGEFNFPLHRTQEITGFAMDIDGKLRKGVIVEKDKGRRVFEQIVREGIDPGLLEKTKGNNFKARVYPILGKGTKRIVVTCQQRLLGNRNNYHMLLPLHFNMPIKEYTLSTTLSNSYKAPELLQQKTSKLRFKKTTQGSVAQYTAQDVMVNELLSLKFKRADNMPKSIIQHENGINYFYTNIPLKVKRNFKDDIENVDILWDVSGSRLDRDVENELNALYFYFQELDVAKVHLTTFSYKIHSSQTYQVKNGDWHELRKAIENLKYDGGSRMDIINFNDFQSQEILLFTDGMSNLGDINLRRFNTPVNTINSSLQADHSLLNHIARKSGGVYIDMSSGKQGGLKKLMYQSLKAKLITQSGRVEECNWQFSNNNQAIELSGILESEEAIVNLEIYCQGSKVDEFEIPIHKDHTCSSFPAARIWASLTIEELMGNKKENKDAIIALAKKFGIVTEYTSLMVLERIEDYLRFDVEPPLELKKEYDRLKSSFVKPLKTDPNEVIKQVRNMAVNYQTWWNTAFPTKINKPKNVQYDEELVIVTEMDDAPAIRDRAPINRMEDQAPPPPPPSVEEELYIVDDETELSEDLSFELEDQCDMPPLKGNRDRGSNITLRSAVKSWDKDAEYIQHLKGLSAQDAYLYYLEHKHYFNKQPSFFIDVSSYLFELKNPDLAISVITNIADLNLANAEIMRIVAYKLIEQDAYELAVQIFESVLSMRPEDLQSFRDLALAYEKNGQYQKALNTFCKALLMPDLRRRSIKPIVLNEMNNLLDVHDDQLNLSEINKDWIYNCPIELRVVLEWSTDNSDLDLWVIEPDGEKCFYSHPETQHGGHLSNDITSGFGPEEYVLKLAKKGQYKIQVQYYGDSRASVSGPITIKAEVFKNYGTPDQESNKFVVQVKDEKEVINLGEVVVD